ncbi:hypothetical protein ACRAWF_40720 [Streptomyces sp. L7]
MCCRGVSEPLGYLLGVQGAALLRGLREGSADRAFVEARIAEIRTLLDTPALAHAEGVTAEPGTVEYSRAGLPGLGSGPHYAAPGNGMIDVEQPVVRRILDGLPVGTALDAACGTGRHTAPPARTRPPGRRRRRLAGHARPGPRASAGRRLPRGRPAPAPASRRRGRHRRVRARPDPRPRTGPGVREFARVLRPGGHLVVSTPTCCRPVSGRPCPAAPARTAARPSSTSTTARSAPTSPRRSRRASRSAAVRNPAAPPRLPRPRRPGPAPDPPVLGPAPLVPGQRRPRPWRTPRSRSSGTSSSTPQERASPSNR